MIDHMGIAVSDLAKSIAFYKQALAPLGYELIMSMDKFAGFGIGGKPDFWLGVGEAKDHIHVAFATKSRSMVRDFYAAAMAAGGTDNGGPGIREIYHPDYYGAFVRDPDGHNIEACCHEAYLG
ncbi:MAG: VOC family protein [Myxococcota bacterium]|nr:VOC family protein [Deltaproteobacteria bacterium]MDQ3337255.1 VOC family protein [Myxococcota bacterium]